jgi:hypothetical protein
MEDRFNPNWHFMNFSSTDLCDVGIIKVNNIAVRKTKCSFTKLKANCKDRGSQTTKSITETNISST